MPKAKKQHKRFKKFWIRTKLLEADVLVCVGSRKQFNKYFNSVFGEDGIHEDENFVGIVFEYSPPDIIGHFYVVWVESLDQGLDDYGTLAHEVTHLVDRIFETHNIPAGLESTELRASCSAFFQSQILAEYSKTKQLSINKKWGIHDE